MGEQDLTLLQLGLFLSNINFWTELQSYLHCTLGLPGPGMYVSAVVTPSGQSVNQSISNSKSKAYRDSRYVLRRRNAAIYRYYTGNMAQP